MRSTSEILAKAADLIGQRGWCQGKLIEQDGSLCTMGAIQLAMGFTETEVMHPGFNFNSFDSFTMGGPTLSQCSGYFYKKELIPPADADINHESYNRLIKDCEQRLRNVINSRNADRPAEHVPEWNDRSTTTKEDVLLALKEACAESLAEGDSPLIESYRPPVAAFESLSLKDIKFSFFADA